MGWGQTENRAEESSTSTECLIIWPFLFLKKKKKVSCLININEAGSQKVELL